MTTLAELAADPADARLRRGAEFMLADTEADVRKEGHGWVCFWGNVLRYVLHAGFDGDPRAARLTDRVIRDATEAGWRCRYNDELPCAGARRGRCGAWPPCPRNAARRRSLRPSRAAWSSCWKGIASSGPTIRRRARFRPLGPRSTSRFSTRPISCLCSAL